MKIKKRSYAHISSGILKLILDILELQMKSKRPKSLRGQLPV